MQKELAEFAMSYPTLKKKTTMILRRHTLQVPAFSISFIFLKLSTSNKIFLLVSLQKPFPFFQKLHFSFIQFFHKISSHKFFLLLIVSQISIQSFLSILPTTFLPSHPLFPTILRSTSFFQTFYLSLLHFFTQ